MKFLAKYEWRMQGALGVFSPCARHIEVASGENPFDVLWQIEDCNAHEIQHATFTEI